MVLPWTTTKCAGLVERLSGIAMVAATTAEYTAAFLYSLALASEVDPGGQFTLSDRQAEVAFRLAKVWRTAAGQKKEGVTGECPGAAAGGPEDPVRREAGDGDVNMGARGASGYTSEDSEPSSEPGKPKSINHYHGRTRERTSQKTCRQSCRG